MANTAQAKKRARQNEATRKRNASLRSALRSAVAQQASACARHQDDGLTPDRAECEGRPQGALFIQPP